VDSDDALTGPPFEAVAQKIGERRRVARHHTHDPHPHPP